MVLHYERIALTAECCKTLVVQKESARVLVVDNGSPSHGAAELREFVMSCRVAKKLCEQSVVLFLAERAAAQGARVFRAAVTPTGRNGALVEAFDAMPFTVREADGRRVYELDLSDTARRRDVVRHPVEATA